MEPLAEVSHVTVPADSVIRHPRWLTAEYVAEASSVGVLLTHRRARKVVAPSSTNTSL